MNRESHQLVIVALSVRLICVIGFFTQVGTSGRSYMLSKEEHDEIERLGRLAGRRLFWAKDFRGQMDSAL